MSPQDDSARDPVRLHAERWAAESPFVGEAAEERAPIHPWYQGHTPFVEGRKLEEMYGPPEAEWESDLTASELVMEEELRLQRPRSQPLLSSQECQKQLKSTSVAVIGGGLAGLMAARELGRHGIKVTVFEARPQVGGRVLSNTTFSKGRITEEGAELIGSFHTRWLDLARGYGLACISRMDENLYEREGLNVKRTLDKPLSMDEICKLDEEMETRVLEPIARDAGQISDPSQPWLEPWLQQYDNTSVADALEKRYGVKRDERLWKAIEFKLVNDEVAPLDEMNFLGLLCKVKAGQDARFCDDTDDLKERVKRRLMRYWNELEIFRCADGCQKLAMGIANEIKTKYGAKLLLSRAVTHIDLSTQRMVLGSKEVVDHRTGKLADGPPVFTHYDYVVLAIPPSVWAGVKITADGEDAHPKDKIGLMGMNPAVKFFSDVKERFWIKEKAAPYGGSLALGQVWEGTDNQTRVGDQGIVLSVFAGPIIAGAAGRRAPTPEEFKKGLRNLYPGYTGDLNKTLFSDWPNVPFIKTGYASPTKGQIFTIGKKLSEPFRGRLFFAGEHTRMDFFGYMEGALRSGERAANTLMLQSCGLLKEPASPSPPVRIASAAPIRAKTASEYETEIPLEEHSTTDYPREAESPFPDRDLFATGAQEEWEPRAAALVAESPFVGTLEERRSRFDEDQLEEEEEAPDELEGEEELEAEEVWEGLEEEQLAPWAAGIDPFPAAPTVAFDFKDDRMMKAFAPVTVSTVTHLCTALVDLTGDPTTPSYAGLNDEEMIFAGSLPKICAMYAAFALRARVQAFVDAAAANGAPVAPPGITSEIEKAWKPKLRALFPARPAKSFGNDQDVTFPKLGQILTFSPEGKVDFKRATPPFTDAQIDRVGEFGAPKGMFHDWMRSMLRWSNNAAASKCILALGYFYLNGALGRAGLFDAATSKGLWLSADYKSHDWVKTETDRQANSAGPLLTPRWATVQRRRRSNITATAAQVARFMTLLAQNKLVDATASHDMRALMKADAGGLGSDANDALRRVGRDPTLVIAKFGRGDDGFNHECAIIERTVAGKALRYVAIGLGSAPKRKHTDLFDLFVLLDETIVTRNK